MINNDLHNIPQEESKFVKELVASREYLFKQIIDMNVECENNFREIAWQWIMDNRKWPSKYRVPCKPRAINKYTGKETKFGWYMSDKGNSQTMQQVADKGSSTIPYELSHWCYVSSSDLKSWYTEEEALLWLVRQLCRMMKRKEDNEAAKKTMQATASNQIS